MTHYAHLTQEQRYQISALLQTNTSMSEIARIIGCEKSSVIRVNAAIVLSKRIDWQSREKPEIALQ